MATTFARAEFHNLDRERSIPTYFAYIGRCRLKNGETDFADFRQMQDDLVDHRLTLPGEFPSMVILEEAANLWDEFERKKVSRWDNRVRKPQAIMQVVFALPPDGEISLDEAIELNLRLVDAVRGSRQILVYSAIHDPSRIYGKDHRNRHAHNIFTLRSFKDGKPDGARVRDLVGRVRKSATRDERHFLAERLDFPRLAWALQSQYFAELGKTLAVDPPAPVGQIHLKRVDGGSVGLVSLGLNWVHANHLIVVGDPAKFVSMALRGRLSIPCTELRYLVAEFSGEQKEAVWLGIMRSPKIRCFARASDQEPAYITTEEVHAATMSVADAIRESLSEGSGDAALLTSISGSAFEDVREAIRIALDRVAARGDIKRVMLVDLHLSRLSDIWRSNEVGPEVKAITCAGALRTGASWGPFEIVVVTRSEAIDDQTLARLVAKARVSRTRLVLGFSEGSAAELGATHRLAAHIVSRMTPDVAVGRGLAERKLRAGLVPQALKALADSGGLIFEDNPSSPNSTDESAGRLVVLDGSELWAGVETYDDRDDVPPGTLALPHSPGYVALKVGDPVVFTRTIYREAHTPMPAESSAKLDLDDELTSSFAEGYDARLPVFRKGALGKVQRIVGPKQLIVKLDSGSSHDIKLETGVTLRSAHRITLAEARGALNERMSIRLSRSDFAWGSILLATRAIHSTLIVYPNVAANLSELTSVVERRLHVGVTSDLSESEDRVVETARLVEAVATEAPPGMIDSGFDFELPRPRQDQIVTGTQGKSPPWFRSWAAEWDQEDAARVAPSFDNVDPPERSFGESVTLPRHDYERSKTKAALPHRDAPPRSAPDRIRKASPPARTLEELLTAIALANPDFSPTEFETPVPALSFAAKLADRLVSNDGAGRGLLRLYQALRQESGAMAGEIESLLSKASAFNLMRSLRDAMGATIDRPVVALNALELPTPAALIGATATDDEIDYLALQLVLMAVKLKDPGPLDSGLGGAGPKM